MAKKKLVKQIKLQIPGGKATPAPPIGPALGAAGVNIGGFVNEFNKATADKQGKVLPTIISVFSDKSFTFITKEPPVAELIKEKAGLSKGSAVPNRDKVGTLSLKQAEEIATLKKGDMNAHDLAAAVQMVKGTARSMGVRVEG
ncbi:MAG: 50S ribosomal protein L11 [Parachlamydiales bacterium]